MYRLLTSFDWMLIFHSLSTRILTCIGDKALFVLSSILFEVFAGPLHTQINYITPNSTHFKGGVLSK